MERDDRVSGARPFDQIRISALDVRLGVRMLVKYRGLSAIAVLGMTVAIAIGAGAFGFLSAMFDTALPLAEPERVISIRYRDIRLGLGNRQTAGDFLQWRGALRTVKDPAAFSDDRRNLIIPGRVPEPIDIAEMTASGFRVARTAALRGRTLLDEDEWQRRFDGDSGIIGRQVRLGGETHTVVGVMPEGFLFPVRHHFWTALRLPSHTEPGRGPQLNVFARVADGATPAQTWTELAVLREQTATAFPETHTNLRPRVLLYATAVGVGDEPGANIMRLVLQTLISLLLVVVAVNVAVLVYARTAARTGEIAVRTALGASRTRIVTQLFVEAFVLCGTAAVLGLGVAAIALAKVAPTFENDMPYWTSFSLSPSLVMYVVALAVGASLIVGVAPALPGTGRRLQAGLQRLGSRGSQVTLGRGWTAMIVAQVAIAVAVLPYAVGVTTTMVSSANSKVRYPIEQFLRASLAVEREAIEPGMDTAVYRRERASRFQSRAAEVLRRLEAEALVASVGYATHFGDGNVHGTIETDSAGRPAVADTAKRGGPQWSGVNRVATNFFSVLDVPLVAGRPFTAADALEGSNTVIVDRAFVARFLGEGNPLGRRLRFTDDDPRTPGVEAGPWLEIVGVVSDFMTGGEDFQAPMIYRATTLEQLSAPLSLAIRIRGAPPATFSARLREITAAVDPTLRLERLGPASEMERERQRGLNLMALGIVVVTGSVLLLSAAGIYAMMSFTVVRRRREIGIRAALGADPRRILTSIFARASAQLAAGVAIGLLLALAFGPALDGDGTIRQKGIVLFPVVAGTIMLVGLLAALGPARRGLSIQPTEALREE
jgi:putative ABC transport system permease protein